MCDLKALSLDQLVSTYITLRDQKAEKKKAADEAVKPYTEALERIEAEVHARLNEAGVDSIKTSSGTAYKKMTASVSIFDKSAFVDYVKANDAFDLLDVRPNKTAIKEIADETQELPPGVNFTQEETIGFRK